MKTAPSGSTADLVLTGSGEMAQRCRDLDWAATPLGPVSEWSQSLRTMASAVLASRNPMLLFWGAELTQIYNDAFRPSLGPSTGSAPRHPRALGMPAAEFWTDVWETIGPQVRGVMEGGDSVWFEDLYLPIERGDGVLDDAWWTYSYSPVRDDDGSIGGTLVVCLETTATVKAHAAIAFERTRLMDLFRHAPAFMCVLRGPDHVFELANENYQKLIGFRDVIGKSIREGLPEIEGQGYLELLDRVLTTGEPFIGEAMPVTIHLEQGAPPEQRELNFVYQAITEADGSRSGVFVHGVDVTDSIRARADAEAANRSKGEFLGMMSHDLRTPLNAIDGYAELLEMGIHGPLNDAQRDAIGRIRRSERHLLGLIKEVLNYTSVEAGAVTYDISAVPLEEVISTCDALTRPQSAARNLVFEIDCRPDLLAEADRDRVQQVLVNLVTNAIKFTDPGGRITVSCVAEDGWILVAVTDTGSGIPPEEVDRIFEPFVQVGADRGSREGIGLGLAISRDLARGMGGDLTVTSAPGAGSTFTLALKRAAPA